MDSAHEILKLVDQTKIKGGYQSVKKWASVMHALRAKYTFHSFMKMRHGENLNLNKRQPSTQFINAFFTRA